MEIQETVQYRWGLRRNQCSARCYMVILPGLQLLYKNIHTGNTEMFNLRNNVGCYTRLKKKTEFFGKGKPKITVSLDVKV